MIIRKAVRGISAAALERFTVRARRAAGVRGEVDVLIASSSVIRRLNRRFLGKDRPTDVLSFPSAQANGFAGDIAIAADVGARNARRFGHPCGEELKILILHGMLHLAGYDHENDRGEMARKEERLRSELRLSAGVIGRSLGPPQAKSSEGHASRRKKTRA